MRGRTLIVGAGAAGCVVAARASEDGAREVVLIEAGPDHPDPAALPDDLRDARRNSLVRHDWHYDFAPTPGQTPLHFPRGKVVGGSSAVNTCIALRGYPADFDDWAARELPEWSWAACLPAFKRLERDLDVHDEWHGHDGPLPIRRHPPGELTRVHAAFLEACDELGYPPCPDHNHPEASGAGPAPMNKLEGRRISAAEAYLTASVRARDNLRIVPRTLARRVLFEGRRVRGLEVQRDGAVERLDADRIVLCAGAVSTPALLLRSGVGPAHELARLQVPSIADVPGVGARLLDHPGAAILLWPRQGTSVLRDPLLQALLRTTAPGSPFPNDLQLQASTHFPIYQQTHVPLVTLLVALGKPRGHGRITIPGARADDKPRIESMLLEHPEDRRRIVEGLMLLGRIARTRAFRSAATLLFPRGRVLDDFEATARIAPRLTGSGYHPCGTVPMGAASDPMAATDGRGRVRGTDDLVVGDASLMPSIPTSNIHLPTLMIGERIGEWLRDGAYD